MLAAVLVLGRTLVEEQIVSRSQIQTTHPQQQFLHQVLGQIDLPCLLRFGGHPLQNNHLTVRNKVPHSDGEHLPDATC